MAVCFRWFLMLILVVSLPVGPIPLHAQIPAPATFSLPVDQLDRYELPSQDNQALLSREMQQRQNGRAPRFATSIPVQITPAKQGRWDTIGDLAVWRLRLYSPGAHSLNLGFTHYQMPQGGKLYLYDPEKKEKRGPFTPADNESHDQLWTPIFPGDEVIIEIQVPLDTKPRLGIELAYVNHDFLGFGQLGSGSCNLDIVCGAADGWDIVEPYRDASRSVGVFSVYGTLLCTGFLVNNTQQDCTPYFLTANHCNISPENAASVVVYWNFENSTCRQPDSFESGQNGDGQLDTYNTGAIFRSSWSNSDFCLIELDDPVVDTANVFFAGWSAADALPEGTVISIHHPLTDEKRISFSEDVTHFGFWGSNEPASNGDHIIVNSWTTGTTQSGSSGGPLFNNRGQAIGQLHGGDAACGNSSYDAFGRIYDSWEGGGTPDSRLKDWLDPIGLGQLSIDGKEQGRCNFNVIGAFTAASICVGDQDTLQLYFGDGYQSTPDIQIGNLSPELNITVESIPPGEDGSTRLVWYTKADTPAGKREFEIFTTYEERTDTSYVVLNILAQPPEIPVPVSPVNMAEGQALKVGFSWEPIANAEIYHLQLATDPQFNELISEQLVREGEDVIVADLEANTTYYWRVAAENTCGISDWSVNAVFQTGNIQCPAGIVADTLIEISGSSANTISSEIELDISGTVASVEINNIDIQHDWVGDLSIVLRSPAGSEVVLLDRPGFPSSLFGCDGSNLLLSFNEDIGTIHQTLENTCSSGTPSLTGVYQPLESLEGLIGEDAGGTWALIVKDQADEDGGALISWELSLCTFPEAVPLISGLSDHYTICQTDSLQLELIISEDFSGEEVTLSMDTSVPGSTVSFSQNPALPGDTVYMLLHEFTATGSYTFELNASDGLNNESIPFGIDINDIPIVSRLDVPENGSSLASDTVTFAWMPTGAAAYRLEISNDPGFATLLQTVAVDSTFYTLELPERTGTFYWRVAALNECGENISEVFSFQFTPSGVSDFLDGQKVKVFPNPFSSALSLEFSRALNEPLRLRVLDVNGRLYFSDEISAGSVRHRLSLDHLGAGVYLLELDYRGQRHLQRLVKGL